MPNAGNPLPCYTTDTLEEAQFIVGQVSRRMYDDRLVYSWGNTPFEDELLGLDAIDSIDRIAEELDAVHEAFKGRRDIREVYASVVAHKAPSIAESITYQP